MRRGPDSSQLSFDWDAIEKSHTDPIRMFEHPSADRLLSIDEGQHFERKSARIEARKLAETICAFSNTDATGGIIAVGVSEGRLEGFEGVGHAKLNKLLKAGIEYCPQAVCQTRTVEIESASILLFRVEYNPYRVVELSDGSVFLRIADQNRRLTSEEILRLKHDKGEVPFELEMVADATFNDLDLSLVRDFANAVRTSEELEFDKSLEDVLFQRRLIKYEGSIARPLNAGMLLFGLDPLKYFPGCKIRFIRYEGTEERTGAELNVIKDTVIEG